LLNAFQRNDITSNIGSGITVLRYLLQAFMLFAFRNYELYIVILPITTILSNIVTAIVARRLYPDYVCRGNISRALKKDIGVKVKGMLITKIQAVTRNSFDSIFISAFQIFNKIIEFIVSRIIR
jgi:heme/copper-type cytochrome/quinol oxidase subunit 1